MTFEKSISAPFEVTRTLSVAKISPELLRAVSVLQESRSKQLEDELIGILGAGERLSGIPGYPIKIES